MAIVKQTLHPEGDTGTDIYPKTSVDQITDLPLSSQKQLYGHYIAISKGTREKEFRTLLTFINSIPTPITSLTDLWNQISARADGQGIMNGDDGNNYNIFSIYKASYTSQTGILAYNIATGALYDGDISTLCSEYSSLEFTDTVIALGSNAG